MDQLPARIHVIGICGVATSAVAIAFHKRGVKVTGSDKGFFPPISTELEKQGISFYAGWHPEKMMENGRPDLIIVGTASGTQNPETLYAKDNNIPTYSYPEIIGKYLIKENSVVCAGTWGKTSSAALLSFILEQAGYDPTYMFGGVSLSHQSSAKLSDGKWSVLEGDEYKSSPTDAKAKFFHYKTTHLLLTAVSWDHADLYPTQADYLNAFKKLADSIPPNGLVVACADRPGLTQVLFGVKSRMISYGLADNAAKGSKDYSYLSVKQSSEGIDFTIKHDSASWHIHTPMLGAYQAENITGCFAMARELGVDTDKIVKAISQFKGLKRRFEKRFDGDSQVANTSKGVTVIDDIAHSPEKAAAVLTTLREIYKGRIIAVFEPNIGGRQIEAASKYDGAFRSADEVIIPRLTKLKIVGDNSDQPIEGDELAKLIARSHAKVKYIASDAGLVAYLQSAAKKGDVLAFLGSHGFRGMIEEIVKTLGD